MLKCLLIYSSRMNNHRWRRIWLSHITCLTNEGWYWKQPCCWYLTGWTNQKMCCITVNQSVMYFHLFVYNMTLFVYNWCKYILWSCLICDEILYKSHTCMYFNFFIPKIIFRMNHVYWVHIRYEYCWVHVKLTFVVTMVSETGLTTLLPKKQGNMTPLSGDIRVKWGKI